MEIPLLLVVVGLHLAYYAHPSLHIVPLVGAGSPVNQILGPLVLGYCWADVGLRTRPELRNRIKTTLLVLLVMLIAVAPLAITMYGRATSAPHLLAHDGLIQTEEAMAALRRGENPYAISYRDTPMALWPFDANGLEENPALEHLVYLPATFLLPWPMFALVESLTGWYDQRSFHLLIFLASWIAASKLLSPTRWRSLTLIMALSPLMLPFFLEGRNDVLILGWLIITTLAFRKGRIALGALALAVACATKPTAWPIVPLFATYLLGRNHSKVKLRRGALIFALVWLGFMIPFLVWDAGAFVEDAVLYQAGRGEQPYPIAGYSLGRLLLSLNLIESSTSPFPFWVFQLGLGLPALVFTLLQVTREPRVGRVWIGYGLLFGTVGFAGRFFNDNHVGYIALVLAIGYLLMQEEQSTLSMEPSSK